MREITFIHSGSVAKIGALLGILWAFLGWLFSGIVILVILKSSAEAITDAPAAFSISGLISGMIGGFIGGGLSGYLGSLVYNFIAKRFGGIQLEIKGGESFIDESEN